MIKDYRDVIVTRNIYESIASGYLYHKTGKECWLSSHGLPESFQKYYSRNLFHWQSIISEELLIKQHKALESSSELWRQQQQLSDREEKKVDGANNSYDFAWICHFKSKEDQDAYQSEPIHRDQY